MMTPNDYQGLFDSCVLATDSRRVRILDYVSKVSLYNETTYKTVERFVSIPWPLVAAIHMRESSQDFTRHLHNGDSLNNRTVHVPEGRPALGQPPFTWIESATDALEQVWRPNSWSIPGCLEFLERYNGLGYRKLRINSPYLWSFTSKYDSGLFVADGRFSPEKIDRSPGCVSLLKCLALKGVSLDFRGIESHDSSLH